MSVYLAGDNVQGGYYGGGLVGLWLQRIATVTGTCRPGWDRQFEGFSKEVLKSMALMVTRLCEKGIFPALRQVAAERFFKWIIHPRHFAASDEMAMRNPSVA